MEKKLRYVWWVIIVILIVIAIWRLFLPHGSKAYIQKGDVEREIVVYITGAVEKGGLINLPVNSRLDDALEIAGLLAEANIELLNLAEKLKDGQKIIVPFKPVIEEKVEEDGTSDSTVNQNPSPKAAPKDNRININTAGVSELDRLPGIGPALAERIIQYRQKNGPFTTGEDLLKVSGIGPKTYEKMADQITVGP